MLGQYFQTLNSLEYIANQFTQSLFGDQTLFDLPEIIESIQLADVLKVGRSLSKKKRSVSFICSQMSDIEVEMTNGKVVKLLNFVIECIQCYPKITSFMVFLRR